jgi:hypothetical protein
MNLNNTDDMATVGGTEQRVKVLQEMNELLFD